MGIRTKSHDLNRRELSARHRTPGTESQPRPEIEASPVLAESIADVADGRGAQAVARYTEDEVRRRAYELFLARDGESGSASSDWYAAEEELRSVSSP